MEWKSRFSAMRRLFTREVVLWRLQRALLVVLIDDFSPLFKEREGC